MAKNFDAADDIGKPGKPVKPATPPRVRRFPWRLWLWALVMTAAAGAGGYFTWFFKSEADTAIAAKTETLERCDGDKKTLLADAATKCDDEKAALSKISDTCKQNLDTVTDKAKKIEAALKLAESQIAEDKTKLEKSKAFEETIKKLVDGGSIKVTSRRGNLVLSLPAEVLFPSGVADISDEGKIKVHKIGFILEQQFQDRRFLVIGHTDNQPLKGSVYKDNWELSTARALVVTRELMAAGMEAKNLVAAGAGQHDPIVPNSSVANMAKNRRIEIALLPDLPAEIVEDKPEPPKKK